MTATTTTAEAAAKRRSPEPRFHCKPCNFRCYAKGDWAKHIARTKHLNNMSMNLPVPPGGPMCFSTRRGKSAARQAGGVIYVCGNCRRSFASNSGLWKHRRGCMSSNSTRELARRHTHTPPPLPRWELNECSWDADAAFARSDAAFARSDASSVRSDFGAEERERGAAAESLQERTSGGSSGRSLEDKQLILELLQQNKDLQQSLIRLSREKTITTNSNNKTFNLQVFLNDTCKDAMNINEFVSSIRPSIMDLEMTGKNGYVNGISSIIINNLKDLDTHYRPIHCSDRKREVMYIKDNNAWERESMGHPILTKAIKSVALENMRNISEWTKDHPGCMDCKSMQNSTFLNIVGGAIAGATVEESTRNIGRIISNIAREVGIEKDAMLMTESTGP